MIHDQYRHQVALLLKILPLIFKEKQLALHGGTAINLFSHPMPRLSVDIDLTYFPAGTRDNDLMKIKTILNSLKENIVQTIPGISINRQVKDANEFKLFCTLGDAMVKIEVNTVNRGVYLPTEIQPLCKEAQKEFNMFCESRLVSKGQLFGGKIVAALDRQHPRDLFDVMMLFKYSAYTEQIQQGVIFSMLSSQRPFHELLQPSPIDQETVLSSQFSGMAKEVFTYAMFEETRERLIWEVNEHLTENEKKLILSFAHGKPEWGDNDFGSFPGVQWKLLNIKKLKENNKLKFERQIDLLEKVLNT
jgi:predicted nucleotidyltransferase component of viral defense system